MLLNINDPSDTWLAVFLSRYPLVLSNVYSFLLDERAD